MPLKIKKPPAVTPRAPTPTRRPGGWNPPKPGPERDRYTQEFIAGKLTQITGMLAGKRRP